MAAKLNLPLSGVVLGGVMDALCLRQWDADDILSSRNASRFLAGARVSQEVEADIWSATARALVAADLVPPVLALGAPVPPDVADKLAEVPQHLLLAEILSRCAVQWDAMVGALHRLAPPVFSERLVRVACLQLVTIDLAVRLTCANR